jgi:Possible lysine decarboxylase
VGRAGGEFKCPARRNVLGVLADACLAQGGQVIGVIPQALLDMEVAHMGLTELRAVSSMHERKAVMAESERLLDRLSTDSGPIVEKWIGRREH